MAAVQQLAPEFRRGDTIVAISADLGEKYLDTIYDPAWVEKVIVPEDDRSVPTYASVTTELGAEKAFDRRAHSRRPERKDMQLTRHRRCALANQLTRSGGEQYLGRA